MKLIVGLGNIGDQYRGTRHNTGFYVIDKYAANHDAVFAPKARFNAAVAETTINGERILIMKPTTYYNLSGEVIHAIATFYKIATGDILVIHDELALPLGTLRTRIGGTDAGNNGIKSLTTHVGEATARLRIGIAGEHRTHTPDTDYVLGTFSKDEQATLKSLLPQAFHLIDSFIRGDFHPTTHKHEQQTDVSPTTPMV